MAKDDVKEVEVEEPKQPKPYEAPYVETQPAWATAVVEEDYRNVIGDWTKTKGSSRVSLEEVRAEELEAYRKRREGKKVEREEVTAAEKAHEKGVKAAKKAQANPTVTDHQRQVLTDGGYDWEKDPDDLKDLPVTHDEIVSQEVKEAKK